MHPFLGYSLMSCLNTDATMCALSQSIHRAQIHNFFTKRFLFSLPSQPMPHNSSQQLLMPSVTVDHISWLVSCERDCTSCSLLFHFFIFEIRPCRSRSPFSSIAVWHLNWIFGNSSIHVLKSIWVLSSFCLS
jgi:hypothetical protein